VTINKFHEQSIQSCLQDKKRLLFELTNFKSYGKITINFFVHKLYLNRRPPSYLRKITV